MAKHDTPMPQFYTLSTPKYTGVGFTKWTSSASVAGRGALHLLPSAPPRLVQQGGFAVAGHCRCASTIRGQFPYCATPQSRANAGVGRPFTLCIVRAMLSRIDSDPIQYQRCDPAQCTCETTADLQDLNAVRVPLGSAIFGRFLDLLGESGCVITVTFITGIIWIRSEGRSASVLVRSSPRSRWYDSLRAVPCTL